MDATSGGAAPLGEVLRQVTARLRAAGVASPRADATVLVAHVLETDAGDVQRRTVLGHTLPLAAAEHLATLVDRRCAREPLQHLTGVAPFRGIELAVGPGVFVPRPETESVAGLAIDACTDRGGSGAPVVVDLCAGSGAIALAVAAEVPGAIVHAVEVSDEALSWARRNVDALGGVTLHRDDVSGDLPTLRALRGAVDVVVSNPPYVPTDAVPVDPEVARHDPHLALYGGGDDGLAVPRAVVERAADLLAPGGVLVVEHAEVQSGALVDMLTTDDRWESVTAHADLTGRPRAVRARRARSVAPGS